MTSIKNWRDGGIDWSTPAGQLLQKFLATLPKERPHPLDILIGKLDRLDAKDLKAFERVIELTGHPTADELKRELQNAVDLFRPAFDEDAPNRYPDNTRRLWREIFHGEIDIRQEIVEPALARRKQGYGERPPDYKRTLGE